MFYYSGEGAKVGIQGHLKFKQWPRLGINTGLDGNEWHVHSLSHAGGKGIVWAVPVNQVHPYFTSTSNQSFGLVSQEWLPYTYEIVSECK